MYLTLSPRFDKCYVLHNSLTLCDLGKTELENYYKNFLAFYKYCNFNIYISFLSYVISFSIVEWNDKQSLTCVWLKMTRSWGEGTKKRQRKRERRRSWTHQRQGMAASLDRPQRAAMRPPRSAVPVLEWTSEAHLHKSYLSPQPISMCTGPS